MKNYNEKIRSTDRLKIIKGFRNYGHSLLDRKTDKNLLYCKSKETCLKGKSLLSNGDIDGFKDFCKEVENEVVICQRIMTHKSKHYNYNYFVPTYNDIFKASLLILKEAMSSNYISDWGEYDFTLDFTLEDIEKMPKSLQTGAKTKLKQHNEQLKYYEENKRDFELAKKAIDTKDGRLAYRVVMDRCDYEYEYVEFEDLIIP